MTVRTLSRTGIEKPVFRKGQRVRWSLYGQQTFPTEKHFTGEVFKTYPCTACTYVEVRWDQHKRRRLLHPDYVEHAND